MWGPPKLGRERQMPTAKLTEKFVKDATVAPGKDRTTYFDEGLPGFGLKVTKTGHKSFVIQYRAGRGRSGTDRLLTIGPAGGRGIALDVAKTEARKHFGQIARGHDPLTEQRAATAHVANTLRAVAESYFAIECGVGRDESGKAVFSESSKLRSSRERLRTFERLVYPEIGSMPIADIRRSHVVRLCDRIADKHGPVMADRALAYVRRVFNWHSIRSDGYISPIVRGMMRAAGRSRERILDDDELRAVWQAAGNAGAFGAMVKFILLTTARRGEAAKLCLAEIAGSDWTLPARRNKTKVDLIRPLPKAAQDLLAAMPKFRGCRYVFTNDGVTAIGGHSKFRAALMKASGTAGWTLHDLRRTSRSLLSRTGVPSDHAEHCLGHMPPGMKKVYDRHKYYDEKRRALEKLAGIISSIVNPPAAGVVVAFPGDSITAASDARERSPAAKVPT
jgi:integrase